MSIRKWFTGGSWSTRNDIAEFQDIASYSAITSNLDGTIYGISDTVEGPVLVEYQIDDNIKFVGNVTTEML